MRAARRRFRRVAWANVLGNAAKIAVEGAAGIVFGSVALLADAAHSVADLAGSVVVLRWGEESFEPPDTDHPHGHGRFEPLTALVVGVLIVLFGMYLLYQSAIGIVVGTDVIFSYLLLGAAGFAIATMAALYAYTVRMNAEIDSSALAALAVDCRNDVFTSMAAGIGVLGVMVGYEIADPLAGGLVSLLVVQQGVVVSRENLRYLLGSSPSRAKRETVRSTLVGHEAVRGVHDLVVYYEGTDLEVEVHVEVDGGMTLREAHHLESELAQLLRALDGIREAHVHLDPSGIGEWKDALEGRGPEDEVGER